MTGTEDDHSNTRPISVAELLARNGTIGAPPIGGRRRRRRGADSITVAELTGEIPIVRDHDDDAPAETEDDAPAETEAAAPAEPEEAATTNGAVDHVEDTVEEAEPEEAPEAVDTLEAPEAQADKDDDYAEAVADYQSHIEQRDADEDLDFFAPPRRSTFARRRFGILGRSAPAQRSEPETAEISQVADETTELSAVDEVTDEATVDSDTAVGAEEMSPDPLDWADPQADEDEAEDAAVAVAEPEDDDDREDLPSYLRSPDNALFGGPDAADDVAHRGNGLSPADIDLDEDEDEESAPSGAMSRFLRGALVVGQCVVAVGFGAGLFIAFDQLWKWNSIVALVLGVLVILGLVVGVRVVRKTEDIGSTLIAVAVGAMVTFGPLALMQAA
ncbi:hypothetical protein [Mycobacterium sp. 1164985.4]|uniref:hypothetical protein n=1 Tax=Mycobacterium sp. 1164985.4 TaxID=1834069 RepID=UPI0007FCD003|nr:hypothetical protein [Mycobacterium sp. 1164985.4]OBK79131.1 hypothetical protein A5650_08930 [Mycobacterium sp. 1164985.4]